MASLLCDAIDMNDPTTVRRVRDAVHDCIENCSTRGTLKFKPSYYFCTPNGKLPKQPGWYIIIEANTPIYVGQAGNLNRRLNDNNGSSDNFATSTRPPDPILDIQAGLSKREIALMWRS